MTKTEYVIQRLERILSMYHTLYVCPIETKLVKEIIQALKEKNPAKESGEDAG